MSIVRWKTFPQSAACLSTPGHCVIRDDGAASLAEAVAVSKSGAGTVVKAQMTRVGVDPTDSSTRQK